MNKKKLGFTNKTAVFVLAEDAAITAFVLYLCYLCIMQGFTGSMAFLTALIGLQQAKSAAVITAAINKSKAEDTKGGIIYDTVIKQTNSNQDCD
ncbi:MAG: hypothetical protein AB7D36_03560 [Oscillospiraceae bacterium]